MVPLLVVDALLVLVLGLLVLDDGVGAVLDLGQSPVAEAEGGIANGGNAGVGPEVLKNREIFFMLQYSKLKYRTLIVRIVILRNHNVPFVKWYFY